MNAHQKFRAYLGDGYNSRKAELARCREELGTWDQEWWVANGKRVIADAKRLGIGQHERHARQCIGPETDPFWWPERRGWFSWYDEDGTPLSDAEGPRFVAEAGARGGLLRTV